MNHGRVLFSLRCIALSARSRPGGHISARRMMRSLVSATLLVGFVCAEYIKTPELPGNSHWMRRDRHVERQSNHSAEWPYGPFSTKGRDIVNARGDVITWAGVNWPMSGETMVPEGLEWASVDEILDDVGSVGWNFIRM